MFDRVLDRVPDRVLARAVATTGSDWALDLHMARTLGFGGVAASVILITGFDRWGRRAVSVGLAIVSLIGEHDDLT